MPFRRTRRRPATLAFASYRVPPLLYANAQERNRAYEDMLCRALNLGTVVAFIGAGCSRTMDYPSWEEFATKTINLARSRVQEWTKGDRNARSSAIYLAQLERFDREIASYGGRSKKKKKKCPADQLMLFIGECQSILREIGAEAVYKKHLATLFGRATPRAKSKLTPTASPLYKSIFALGIKRFVTTNYDLELERQLLATGLYTTNDEALKGFGGAPAKTNHRLVTFSQSSYEPRDLARFALAEAGGADAAVFHCHGRYDEPKSVIASEADYQRWYLSEDESHRTFRQTIELLLESNPLLFIGYGLSDDDLLRPLRYLKATDPSRTPRRPLFAMVPAAEASDSRVEVLYERYGMHVITFKPTERRDAPPAEPASRDDEEPPVIIQTNQYAAALGKKLEDLRQHWQDDRREWTEKPKVFGSTLKLQPSPVLDNPCQTEFPPVREPDAAKLRELLRQPGLVGLKASAGSGKSRHLLWLLTQESMDFPRAYYWNAHYSNEFLPAFDAALAFFGGPRGESRHDTLRRQLTNNRFLLVIDGCERFLRETGKPGEVRCSSMAFWQLLEDLGDQELLGTVLISGRILPAQLAGDKVPARRTLHLDRPTAKNLKIGDARHGLVSALCSLLQGHSYGLCMAKHLLDDLSPDENATKRLQDLVEALATRSPYNRLQEMVNRFVDALQPSETPYRAFLESLAQFVGPVCLATCEVCYCNVLPSTKTVEKDVRKVLAVLKEKELVFESPPGGRGEEKRYCVHSTARTMLLQPRHGLAPDVLPDFGLSGFTSGRIDAYLDPEWRPQKLLDLVMHTCRQRLEAGRARPAGPGPRRQAGPPQKANEDLHAAAGLCIDAFALLRNTMAASTAPREGDYGSFIDTLIRMLRLVKDVCGLRAPWDYCEYPDRHLIESPQAPLHVAELAWLYNELGLALSAEGQLYDAYAVWEQTYEIARVMEHPRPGGSYRIEVLLNLTHLFIERGRLRESRRYLSEAESLNTKLQDRDIQGRILGFRGLLAHLAATCRRQRPSTRIVKSSSATAITCVPAACSSSTTRMSPSAWASTTRRITSSA